MIVSRETVSDLPILRPAVSRRRAELRVDDRDPAVLVTALGSRNGTWINEVRVPHGAARAGASIAFGTAAFTWRAAPATPVRPTSAAALSDPAATVRREREVLSADQALADVPNAASGTAQATQRLRPLVRIARCRGGIPCPEPRAIASGVAERQVALLTNAAGSDERTVAAAAVDRETAAALLLRAARVREDFERYFTPRRAERIARTTTRVEPGVMRQDIVVLFSDIRGFTAHAERLPATDMANQLNESCTALMACVCRPGGALDKCLRHAIKAAWRDVGRPELHAGIGVHQGEAFAGNVGSPRRLEFTRLGNTVNVASRLCSLAQAHEVVVSERIVKAVPVSRAVPVSCRSREELRVLRRNRDERFVRQVERGA